MSVIKNFSLRSGMLLALFVFASTSIYAQRAGENDEEAPAADGTIDQQTGKILSEAIEFLNNDQFVEARARLGDLRVDRLSPFERSRLEQLLFSLDMNDENYEGARSHLQAAIDSGGLNPQESSTMRYQMAQLWFQEEKWVEGAAAMEAWIATEPNPNSGAYYLLAAAYYYQELFDRALPNAQKAVDLAETPQESWLSMLAALLIQKEDYSAALEVVKRMVNMFPDKKNYWMQLSGLYTTLDDYANGLIVMEFANYGGMLTEASDIRRLADLYQLQEMPYRAAVLMEAALADGKVEKNLRSYEGLANNWIAAREFEKAVPILGLAAEMSDNGALYQRMGEVNIQIEEWEACVDAFDNALDKGELRDAGYVQLMMGVCYYNLERYDEARTWLGRAANVAAHRSQANGYIQMIDSKSN